MTFTAVISAMAKRAISYCNISQIPQRSKSAAIKGKTEVSRFPAPASFGASLGGLTTASSIYQERHEVCQRGLTVIFRHTPHAASMPQAPRRALYHHAIFITIHASGLYHHYTRCRRPSPILEVSCSRQHYQRRREHVFICFHMPRKTRHHFSSRNLPDTSLFFSTPGRATGLMITPSRAARAIEDLRCPPSDERLSEQRQPTHGR